MRVLGEAGLGEPVLDISDETVTIGEGGLLGIAFDEPFAHFYLSYTDLAGDTVVAEIAVADDGELQLDTRRTVFTQEQPFSNHNGGHIAFGPDGLLYLALGDGGDSGDPLDSGQDLSTLLGTLPFSGEEPADHVPPVFEYDNDGARCSITGGYVYRGSAIPDLQGAYLFSDYCNGTIRALEIEDGQVLGEINLGVNAGNVVSFVQGPDLELYALNIGIIGGTVFRIDPA